MRTELVVVDVASSQVPAGGDGLHLWRGSCKYIE